MLVMGLIALICVLGIVGALASTLNYDQLYGQSPRPLEPSSRPVRRRRSRRRSRQLRAVEAALAAAETPAVTTTPHVLADPTVIQHEPPGRRP